MSGSYLVFRTEHDEKVWTIPKDIMERLCLKEYDRPENF